MKNYNQIKDVLFKRGNLGKAVIMAMHTTETYKFIKDELDYLQHARNLLRDELLSAYEFLDRYDLFEIFLDDKEGLI
ncbi:hypothetical protein SAMN04487770_1128 [Butyrivibrio sp. ob235]|uniref:hypothetical protein n=1 Tax=Butyrivibrio sp. ob235 TaxID=1761780 RepID=UPI0008D5D7D8|nr:hypothetical protein [Butyrivibrio sp. ob235]SEL53497.1 hypothetical protein SAMN04487770_1128 [Butyrivibrio sp. ob235]